MNPLSCCSASLVLRGVIWQTRRACASAGWGCWRSRAVANRDVRRRRYQHALIRRVGELQDVTVDAHVAPEPVGEQVGAGPVAGFADLHLTSSVTLSSEFMYSSVSRTVWETRYAFCFFTMSPTSPIIASSSFERPLALAWSTIRWNGNSPSTSTGNTLLWPSSLARRYPI